MLTKLSTIGTLEACHVATVAAHFRLSAQQISVTTATARTSQYMGVLPRARMRGATAGNPGRGGCDVMRLPSAPFDLREVEG